MFKKLRLMWVLHSPGRRLVLGGLSVLALVGAAVLAWQLPSKPVRSLSISVGAAPNIEGGSPNASPIETPVGNPQVTIIPSLLRQTVRSARL